MRPVNLLPPELRPRIPGEGDSKIAWGIVGGLALLLVLVIASIALSNKAKTINDEAVALQAEADKRQAAVAMIPKGADTVTEQVRSRTLLVGGLAAVRFPWDDAMLDLSKSLPPDVTLDTISAITSGTDPVAGTPDSTSTSTSTTAPTLTLGGCASGWTGYSRLLTWLKQMPNVRSVKSNSSAVTTAAPSGGEGEATTQSRTENCGPRPLNFNLIVAYRPHSADLLGLPRPEAAPAGATGTTGAAPAAQTTPPAGG